MDLQPNKIDGIIKPITNKRISASEWNQLVGSCMEFIYEAGYTPDPNDNKQFLNAFKAIWEGQEGGQGKSIGEVYYSQSSSAEDNPGGLPLFTGETIASASTVYPDFYAWVESHADLQVSAADYNTAITTYGECPYYVIDTVNKTIRLPLLKNYIKNANTADGITQAEAGLPNITGIVKLMTGCGGGSGALYDTTEGGTFNNGQGGSGGTGNIGLDASRSSSVYGNSDTNTPAHTTLFPWVCAYNAAVEASVAQAAQFLQALTGKVDLASGVTQADVDYVIESYKSGTSWYRLYKSGWCEQGGRFESNDTADTQCVFLKEMADTNYSFCGMQLGGNGQAMFCNGWRASNLSTTGFYIYNATNGTNSFSWIVCGYAA